MNSAMLFTWTVESVLLALLALLSTQYNMCSVWLALTQLVLSVISAVLLVGCVAMQWFDWAHSVALGFLAHTSGLLFATACTTAAAADRSDAQFAIELAFFCIFELVALGTAFSSATGPTALMFSQGALINVFLPMVYVSLHIVDIPTMALIGVGMAGSIVLIGFNLERVYHIYCVAIEFSMFVYYLSVFGLTTNWPLFSLFMVLLSAQTTWLVYSFWKAWTTTTTTNGDYATIPSAPPLPPSNNATAGAMGSAEMNAFQMFYDIPLLVNRDKKRY